MSVGTNTIEQLSINTIRTLSMDAVQKATCGHPGTPMALAPVAYSLWNHTLNFDPSAPRWAARDRFVLSCGHASMLIYSVLHLAGVQKVDADGNGTGELTITLDDIKNFRQMHSPCAGHPELGEAEGIETTTGPLGQGCGNSVGMAITAKWKAANYNRPGFELFDFNTYALCSDGDLMEGIACEAASLAGHLKLDNLCWIYDDNRITIEGETDLAFSEDVGMRFEGLGWNVLKVDDANDLEAINAALSQFKEHNGQPTLIILRSIIGYGSPNKADTSAAHGAALGEEEVRLTKENLGWDGEQFFVVPDGVRAHFDEGVGVRGKAAREAWDAKFSEYQTAHPELAAQWQQGQDGTLPEGWDKDIPTFEADAKGLASRASSGQVLNAIAERVPSLIGGSADLAPSTNTLLKFDGAGHFGADDYSGRNFHFGIREHGMAAICNGMALSGVRPYGATFFVFSDYLRPSLRLAALMNLPVLTVLTHDSIGVGEDGPTHQPIEQLAAARSIPRLIVMRPADANEVASAYRTILPINDRPVAMVLTRQNLPTLDRSIYASAEGVAKGGYILADADDGNPQVILIASGSEVNLCVEAYQTLKAEGVSARVVSMPSFELFEDQDEAYRQSVLPSSITARVAVEAGIQQGWDRYIGLDGRFVGMNDFGASAPANQLSERYGLTSQAVAQAAKEIAS